MIQPGDLHRYFKVREIATGRDVWLLAGDIRYELTGADSCWNYRPAAGGEYFLAESAVPTHPWGRPMRLDEVEPLPDGGGLWPPVAWEHIHGCPKCLATTPRGIAFGEKHPSEHADRLAALLGTARFGDAPADATCTDLDCTECGAKAGQPCEIWCIADQAVPAG